MRTRREDVLPRSERLRVLGLDVTKPDSIAAALEASGPIDVLVNNAGIGAIGAFEATPEEHEVRTQSAERANSLGEQPVRRVKAVLNALADWYPTLSAASASGGRSRRSMSFARAMRHSRRYCIGGIPTLRAKRSANTARDIPAVRAGSSTVHRRATSTRSRRRILLDPGRLGVMTRRRHGPWPRAR